MGWIFLLLILGCLVASRVYSRYGERGGWLLSLLPLAGSVCCLLQTGYVSHDDRWLESTFLGEIKMDGLTVFLGLLVNSVGTLVMIYSSSFMLDQPRRERFPAWLLCLILGLNGVIFCNHLLAVLIFWEASSLATRFLIGCGYSENAAKEGRLVWKFNLLGTICLAVAFTLLGIAGEAWTFTELQKASEMIHDHPLYPALVVFTFSAVFIRCAQWPFDRWILKTVEQPPASSACIGMLKAGVFLLLKLYPILGETYLWSLPLVIAGSFTMLYGAVRGLYEIHIKRILALITISSTGLLISMIGIGSVMAIQSALLFLFGQVISKSALYMSAGFIYRNHPSMNISTMGSLGDKMRIAALGVTLAVLSKVGFPPFLGAVTKPHIFEVYHTGIFGSYLEGPLIIPALLTNILLMVLTLNVGLHPYWDKSTFWKAPSPHSMEPPPAMQMGVWAIALTAIFCGTHPLETIGVLMEPAVSVTLGEALTLEIRTEKSLEYAQTWLSLSTLIIGMLIFLFARKEIWAKAAASRSLEAD